MTELATASMSEDINNNENTESQQKSDPVVEDEWMVGTYLKIII